MLIHIELLCNFCVVFSFFTIIDILDAILGGKKNRANASSFNLVTGGPSNLQKNESEFVNPIIRTTSSGQQVLI